jgi:hypothetical protein
MLGLLKTILNKRAVAGYQQALYLIPELLAGSARGNAVNSTEYILFAKTTLSWIVQSIGMAPSSAYTATAVAAFVLQHISSLYR